MIGIDVSSRKYECHIDLRERVTVIVGDSGVGKTVFANAIQNRAGVYKITLSDNRYGITRLLSDSWYAVLTTDLSQHAYKVYVIDDEDFMYTKEFAKVYEQINNCYFIFISRLDIGIKTEKWNTIPFSSREIYSFQKNGKKHTIVPAFHYMTFMPNHNSSNLIDLCLTEDSGAGYEFFKFIFKNVASVKSKDKVLSFLKKYKEMLYGKNVYLVLDISAAGLRLNYILEYTNSINVHLYFCSKYESFEYLLLKSNFFRIEDDEIFNQSLLEYLTVERKCVALLKKYTKGKPYLYTKGSLVRCYYEQCCHIERKEGCDKGMSGDKIVALLNNTEFAFLLNLRQV